MIAGLTRLWNGSKTALFLSDDELLSGGDLPSGYRGNYILILPKTKKFGCVGRGDLTSLFFSKVAKY